MFIWNWMYTTVCKCTSFVLIYIEIKIERMSNKTFFRVSFERHKMSNCVELTKWFKLQNWLFSQGKLKRLDLDHDIFHVLPLQLYARSEFNAATYFKPVWTAATEDKQVLLQHTWLERYTDKKLTRNRWSNMTEILGELFHQHDGGISPRCETLNI